MSADRHICLFAKISESIASQSPRLFGGGSMTAFRTLMSCFLFDSFCVKALRSPERFYIHKLRVSLLGAGEMKKPHAEKIIRPVPETPCGRRREPLLSITELAVD